jgi:hypothetical protein
LGIVLLPSLENPRPNDRNVLKNYIFIGFALPQNTNYIIQLLGSNGIRGFREMCVASDGQKTNTTVFPGLDAICAI